MDLIIILTIVILSIVSGFTIGKYIRKWSHFEKRKTIEIFEKITKDGKKAKMMYILYRVTVAIIIVILYILLTN